MAATVIEIWNRALNKIGETDVVTSESEDRLAARTCNRVWADIRDEVLCDYPWEFAKKQAELTEDTLTERVGWEHIYTLPADFLRARALLTQDARMSVLEPETREPFELMLNDAEDGQILCCDVAEADIDVLEYTAQIDDVTLYPPAFVNAVAFRLAEELAYALKKNPQMADIMRARYAVAGSVAFAQQLRGQQDDPPLQCRSMRSRN